MVFQIVRPRLAYIVLIVATISAGSGLIWVLLDGSGVDAPRPANRSSRMERTSEDVRHQLQLDLSKTKMSLDEPISLTVRFQNIDNAELSVAKWTRINNRSQPTFFVTVGPSTLYSFGIFPTNSFDGQSGGLELQHSRRNPSQNYSLIHHLSPGEVDITEWRGTLRELLHEMPLPAGPHEIRVTYLGGPNAVTSEWAQVEVVRERRAP
jgi:hypothetical protein